MDFSQIDIHAFLKASMPHRFQDISPYDFENFMATLFRADGYTVQETGYSGDYGADLILTKDGETTAVQVKRYAAGSQVSVGDVNQVIGACSYYKAHNALVVTTSDFTASAITLAKTADVFLWNWQRLEKYISTVFLEGQDYHLFFGHSVLADDAEETEHADMFSITLLQIEDESHAPDDREAIEVHVGFSNHSQRNLTIHIDLPIVISKKSGRQVTAIQWKENYFFHGVLVSGATVELACFFLKAQIPFIKPGDRMILYIHVAGDDQPVVMDEKLSVPRNNCYIVTYCHGRDSEEYRSMIRLRDQILVRSAIGRTLVKIYYRHSPGWVWRLRKSTWTTRMIHKTLRQIVSISTLVLPKRSVPPEDLQ